MPLEILPVYLNRSTIESVLDAGFDDIFDNSERFENLDADEQDALVALSTTLAEV